MKMLFFCYFDCRFGFLLGLWSWNSFKLLPQASKILGFGSNIYKFLALSLDGFGPLKT